MNILLVFIHIYSYRFIYHEDMLTYSEEMMHLTPFALHYGGNDHLDNSQVAYITNSAKV